MPSATKSTKGSSTNMMAETTDGSQPIWKQAYMKSQSQNKKYLLTHYILMCTNQFIRAYICHL